MNECVVSIEDGEKGDFCLCKGCQFLVAPTLVKKEWLGQSGDLNTYRRQLIIEERRENRILQQFRSIILLYLSS